MNQLQEIKSSQLTLNPFQAIGKDWLLITAEKGGKVNTMTASWGGMGILWNKEVAFIFIRPHRYTKEFVDGSDAFSLTFFPDGYRKELTHLGTVSGRDENKIETCGFTVLEEDGVPYFQEAQTVIICRKLYAQDMTAESFIDKSLIGANYPADDFHTLYVGEIVKVLDRQD